MVWFDAISSCEAFLDQLDEAIASVKEEIEELRSGKRDLELAKLALQPVSENFQLVLDGCSFPAPLIISPEILERALAGFSSEIEDSDEGKVNYFTSYKLVAHIFCSSLFLVSRILEL